MDVSVVIVNYNTRDLTLKCINSLFAQTSGVLFEVIVVDNASTDGSVELFEKDQRIRFVRSSSNLGFGKANNLGYQYSSGKYVFFLNSDTILVNNALKLFFEKMESSSPHVGCMGCLLQDAQGNGAHSYADFPTMSNLLFDACPYLFKLLGLRPMNMDDSSRLTQKNDLHRVDYVTGADLFVRRNVIEECGGFDPAFFMYYEDPEMQYRFSRAGYHSYIYDAPKIIHLEGKSTVNERSGYKRQISRRSKVLYLERTQPRWKVVIYKVFDSICSGFS